MNSPAKRLESRGLLAELEKVTGGPVATAKLLQVDYNGGYARWKSGRAVIPNYVRSSVLAHLVLAKMELMDMKDQYG